MTMIAEGAEAKRAEEAAAERKRKAEEKERWEGAFTLSCAPSAPSRAVDLSPRGRPLCWRFLKAATLMFRLCMDAETREDRVHDWRNFNKKKKKTKKGPQVLG